MAIFDDYVNSYEDLNNAFTTLNANATTRFGQSVINPERRRAYLDATDSYDDLQTASTDYNWEHYVWTGGNPNWSPDKGPCIAGSPGNDCQSDLEKAWREHQAANPGASKEEWGKQHYQNFGSRPEEQRVVPFNGLGTVLWGAGQYVARHAQLYNKGVVPEIYRDGNGKITQVSGKNGWGQKHWEEYGKNEPRVLPGPVFGISNGQLYVNSDTVGAGLTKTLEAIKDNFTQGAYPFATLMSNINSSIDSNETKNILGSTGNLNTLADYYKTTKVPLWDASAEGLQPPVGSFEASYYKNTSSGKQARKNWNAAKNSITVGGRTFDNYDITARYGDSLDTYYHHHYTAVGAPVNKERGNAVSPEVTQAWMAETGAGGYTERLTDAQKQSYRDQVLGITGEPGQEKIELVAPEYDEEGNLLNPEAVDTTLETQFATVLTAKDAQREKQLGALAQDVLKTSINELKAAKAKEANLGMMKNLPGYDEILSINSTLANSILGDTGVGGLLSSLGVKGDYKSDLQKSIEKITGVSSNSTLYNWQKWFEDTLVKRYEDYEYEIENYTDEELKQYQERAKEEIDYYNEQIAAGETDVAKPVYLEIAEQYGSDGKPLDVNNMDDFKKIMFNVSLESQKEFVSSFINKYLKPRFDQSKSMDEFISYLDVKEEEQNVFQSQTVVNKLKQIADLRAKGFIDLINESENAMQNFNADFYFDPVTNNTKEISASQLKQYEIQKDTVASDFENAKNGTIGEDRINWALEAYRYGVEKDFQNDPAAFARLHYQVKGRFLKTDEDGNAYKFDPAEDILPYQELEKKIKDFGAELALRKELYGDAGFMQFVTPEEYADYLLKSVDPTKNKEEWQKILTQLGLDYTEDIQQVKDYLIEAFRTEEAKQIRENIKYLNEAQEDLTQASLGVSYIEREEDKKEVTEGQTALYNIFKNAGYGGTEDEFYSDFMPDVDRSDQQLIAQSMTDKGLTFDVGEMEDPFTAFTNISGLFGDDASVFEKDEDAEPKETSYFNIFGGDTEELPKKSKAAQSFLGEFTSMFSGFS